MMVPQKFLYLPKLGSVSKDRPPKYRTSKKKVRLVNDLTYRRNPILNSGIYLNTSKVAQFRLVNDNTIEKEESKRK